MDVPKLRREAKRIRGEEKPDLSVAMMGLDGAREQEGLALASLVFMRHKGKLKAEDWPHVARWAQGVESPEAADLFAQYVAGPLYAREPEEALATRWARSAEPAQRRLALRVAGMDVAEALLADEDARVQEALIDALHALGAKDPDALFTFLRKHKDAPDELVRQAAAALPAERALELTIALRGARPPHDRRPAPRRRGA